MIVHIFADTPHHYIPMSGFFLHSCSISHEQEFWVLNKDKTQKVDKHFKAYNSASDLVDRLALLPKEASVIFHGLFDIHVWKKMLFSSLLNRCSCVFWGAELYRHGKSGRTFKQHIAQLLHAVFVNRCANIYALNDGDAALATRYLKRKEVKVLPYPIIGVDVDKLSELSPRDESNKNSSIKIMVGNSANSSNEHLEVFNRLSHLSNETIEIIVPLNYGGTNEYVDEVISAGSNIFGNKFKPITKMMEKCAYDQLLSNIDITVFAQHRQQGLYAVYAMLLMGKPVVLRESTSSFSNLSSLGFELSGLAILEQIDFETLQSLVNKKRSNNIELMRKTYTEQALAPRWSRVLNHLGKH